MDMGVLRQSGQFFPDKMGGWGFSICQPLNDPSKLSIFCSNFSLNFRMIGVSWGRFGENGVGVGREGEGEDLEVILVSKLVTSQPYIGTPYVNI